jgi:hypothetical protein
MRRLKSGNHVWLLGSAGLMKVTGVTSPASEAPQAVAMESLAKHQLGI